MTEEIKIGDKIEVFGYVYPSRRYAEYDIDAHFADPMIGIVKSIEKMPYPDYKKIKNVLWFEDINQNNRLYFCHIKQCRLLND